MNILNLSVIVLNYPFCPDNCPQTKLSGQFIYPRPVCVHSHRNRITHIVREKEKSKSNARGNQSTRTKCVGGERQIQIPTKIINILFLMFKLQLLG